MEETPTSLPPEHQSSFEDELQQSVQQFLKRFGSSLMGLFEFLGGISVLVKEVFINFFTHKLDWRYVVRQIHYIGVKSLSLTNLIAVFTGMVLALQFIVGLRRFGLQLYAGQVVGVAISRELGPVLTALMEAARVGSGIASELGSMNVSDQILAIRAMGGSPVTKLVLPRIIVTTLITPLLTIFSIVIGILGGMVVSVLEAGVTPQFYLNQVTSTVEIYDFFSGVAKTVFFGFAIGTIACYKGMTTTGGTKGVGEATTQTVVNCAIVIFISDFFLTKLFLVF